MLYVLLSVMLTALSRRFGHDIDLVSSLTLIGLLVGAGTAFALGLPSLIAASAISDSRSAFLAIALAAGFVARLILFASEPILEDDYQRYLWDGAVTASGYNPYALPPLAVLEGSVQGGLKELAADAGPVLSRINHKSLTTIYPPVAQATFAVAFLIEPWSLAAWRAVLLAFDFATLGLLILLLDAIGRSRLWSALYWLNPVVLKEVFNSAHMEAVILPFVLLALLLTLRHRPLAASMALGLAAGAKFWPTLLLPLMLRNVWDEKARLAAAVLIFASLAALWVIPMLISPVADKTNGLLAYIDGWQINSALFPAIVSVLSALRKWMGFGPVDADHLARALVAILLLIVSVGVVWRKPEGADDLIFRASIIVGALVLLSPAVFPWYTLWMAQLLPFRPHRAFLLLTGLIPLYYSFFFFAARGTPQIFNIYVVAAIWVPVWIVLIRDMAHRGFWCGPRASA